MNESPAHPLLEPFEATIQRYGDDPDVCTITPQHASDYDRLTTWITAEEGSFCSAEEYR